MADSPEALARFASAFASMEGPRIGCSKQYTSLAGLVRAIDVAMAEATESALQLSRPPLPSYVMAHTTGTMPCSMRSDNSAVLTPSGDMSPTKP